MLSLLNFQKEIDFLLQESNHKSFLLAISGGVDSMVILNLFKFSHYNFEVAHVNYHLRDEDSNLDEQLVRDYCLKNKIPFHCHQVNVEDIPENSIENWAREIRYKFFRQIQIERGIDYLVTAHHLNDQLETFIMNLSRGSGLRGLSGIPANDNNIIRPLLNFSKAEIYQYAKENNIDYREDFTNAENDFLRNKIRNIITPELLKINNNFLDNFSKSIRIINQSKEVVNQLISHKIQSFESDDSCVFINKNSFTKESELVRYEILNHFGFNDSFEIEKMLNAETGSVFYSKDYKIVVNRDQLIIANKLEIFPNKEIELKIVGNKIFIPEEIENQILKFGECEWFFDVNKFQQPLKLRHKQEGDVFFPNGMSGKKKISKFFKDEKLSILAKPKVWLLCDANDEVLGVLPFRQDRRFSSDEKQDVVLKIKKNNEKF